MPNNWLFHWWQKRRKRAAGPDSGKKSGSHEAFVQISEEKEGLPSTSDKEFLRKLSEGLKDKTILQSNAYPNRLSKTGEVGAERFLHHDRIPASLTTGHARDILALDHVWSSRSSIRKSLVDPVQKAPNYCLEAQEGGPRSLFSRLSQPFVGFKSVANSNWTLFFTNIEERNYNSFSHGKRLRDLDTACAFWLISLIALEILNETVPLPIPGLNLFYLRIWYCISIAATILIWAYRAQIWFKRKISLLSTAMALNAVLLGIVYSILASDKRPDAIIFLVLILLYALLNIHFVLAFFFALIPTVGDIVTNVSNSVDWKYTLCDICFYIIANSFGLFHSYEREKYQRKVYLKISAIIEAQEEILAETEKSEALLLAILPKKILDELRESINESQDFLSSALPRVRSYRKSSITFRRGVTIVYADIVDFTKLSSHFSADKIVRVIV